MWIQSSCPTMQQSDAKNRLNRAPIVDKHGRRTTVMPYNLETHESKIYDYAFLFPLHSQSKPQKKRILLCRWTSATTFSVNTYNRNKNIF